MRATHPEVPSAHPVSDALLHLNRLGWIVDANGFLTVDGEPVRLVVRNGRIEAEARGAILPFSLFAKCLRPVDRPSYPPRGVDSKGVPSWAEGPDLLPPRKDMR